jgi:hypothetical protein
MARRAVALFGAVGLLIPLAACMTPEQIRQHDEQTCVGYGFKPHTDAFAACLQQEVLARQYILESPFWGPHHYWH